MKAPASACEISRLPETASLQGGAILPCLLLNPPFITNMGIGSGIDYTLTNQINAIYNVKSPEED